MRAPSCRIRLAGGLETSQHCGPDTDWHMPRLYDFLDAMGATTIVATYSRYVVDVNRPPGGENLYPGRDTPRLCPIDTFDCRALYRDGAEPSQAEIDARVAGRSRSPITRPSNARSRG
jgi:N-formylglutamate deformylase